MPNPVVHFEIVGQDAAKLQQFYGDLFGWKINADNPMNYGIVDNGGEGINGGIGPAQSGQGHVTVYAAVDDPQAFLDKVEQLGGKTVVGVTQIPNMGTFALVPDPEGHTAGLV